MQNIARLLYWMKERDNIRIKKEKGFPKPWSDDTVFQNTYFCNVHREHDKVTKFVRQMYSPHVADRQFERNIILSRFLNWPPTLSWIGYQHDWEPERVKKDLTELRKQGKVWGNAYVVTTHGIKMDKIDYLCDRVMPSIEIIDNEMRWPSCAAASVSLMQVEGVSTFMAAQIVADLKNTPGHQLMLAKDWWSFALPGPGSRRGMDWLCGEAVPERDWYSRLLEAKGHVEAAGWEICCQDLQNCLCEFDKYMRVSSGTGRSKRSYPGVHS